MNYFRSRITGKIITEKNLRSLYDIYGKGEGNVVDSYIMKEIVEPIDPPCFEDCLHSGNDGVAIVRFRELNPESSFEEAKKAIMDLRREFNNSHKNRKRTKRNKNV